MKEDHKKTSLDLVDATNKAVRTRVSIDEKAHGSPTPSEDVERLEHAAVIVDVPEYTEAEKTRILRKIDWRLVPLLTSLYLFSFLDRGNIGNAKVAGLAKDLNLKGLQYNVALTSFFISYALLEIPSNIILKLMRPSHWITILMFWWGVIMTTMGFVQNFHTLCVARFFLGVAESGFFPAATYLLTIWYLRYEVQTRMVIFYAAASLSGAFSGILAYGIEHMDGVGNLEGWRWIFILEGLVTVFISFFVWYLLPDRPGTAKFLTPEEREFVIGRLQLETGSGKGRVTNEDRIGIRHVKQALGEWRIYLSVIPFWGNSIGVYGFTYTVPTVIEELGYSAANAQLMTVPVYVTAMIVTVTTGIFSDRYQQRSPFIMLGLGIAAAGFIALLAVPHPDKPGLTYGFLFVAASGLYMPLVPIVCWVGNNLAPSSKRAVGMALLISCGNLGGIAGSNIYLAKEAPHYWTGYGFTLAVLVCGIIATFILRVAMQRINAKRDEMSEEEIRAKYTEAELLEMGDRSPYFRYTL